MLQSYPVSDNAIIDDEAIINIEWLKNVVIGIRNIRGEMNIPPAKMLTVYLRNGSKEDKCRLDENRIFLMKLTHLEEITWISPGEIAPVSLTALVGAMEILVPMAGLIDKETETIRLGKELEKIQKEAKNIKGKLSNESFVKKAPPEIVAKERDRLDELETTSAKLIQQKENIVNL